MAGDTTAARAAIVRALVAGNGRSNVVPDLGELTRRLVEDGAEFDDAVLFTALVTLIRTADQGQATTARAEELFCR